MSISDVFFYNPQKKCKGKINTNYTFFYFSFIVTKLDKYWKKQAQWRICDNITGEGPN